MTPYGDIEVGCLMAPIPYRNQCWLIINGFCGIHKLKKIEQFLRKYSYLENEFENDIFKITATWFSVVSNKTFPEPMLTQIYVAIWHC